MSLVPLNPAGIRQVVDALRAGTAVILPPPSPLTYGVAGTDPGAVNRAKGRPSSQPVAVGITSLQQVGDHLDVTVGILPLIDWLVFSELLTVLAPVRASTPRWLEPAVAEGTALIAGAWLPEVVPVVSSVETLYLSSGNRTGRYPIRTAPEVDAEFDHQMLVLDADSLRDGSLEHGATTTLRVSDTGNLDLTRHGIQDAGFGDDTGHGYLTDLLNRFAQSQSARS